MKHWKLEIKLSVADSWVADGFDAKERIEEIEDTIKGLLPYAYGHEVIVKARLVSIPDPKQIAALQNGDLEAKD